MSKVTILLILFLVFAVGCSKNTQTPVAPVTDDAPLSTSSDPQILISGTMNLDDGTVEFNERTPTVFFNVTSLVGSNFRYFINGINPPNVFDITLSINNVSGLTVYDVAIIFTNLYGKSVDNLDSSMDLFGVKQNPFIAFRKEVSNRAFPPIPDTEQLLLKYPAGNPPFVDFIIVAHLGGNTGGVYQIGEWNVDGKLTTAGGEATISVRVLDHQNNVVFVSADTTSLTGGFTPLTQTGDPEVWEATISNTLLAPTGIYSIEISSLSPSVPTYITSNVFDIEVFIPDDTQFGTDIDIIGDQNFPWNPGERGGHSIVSNGDHFCLVFSQTTPPMGDNEGALYFSQSFDAGVSWSPSIRLTSITNDSFENYPCIGLGTEKIYISYTEIDTTDFSSQVKLLVSTDGITFTTYDPTDGMTNNNQESSIWVEPGVPVDDIYIAFIELDPAGRKIVVSNTTNLSFFDLVAISDVQDIMVMHSGPTIAYDSVSDHIMVCWLDPSWDTGTGQRISFDITDNFTQPLWNTDRTISDVWVTDDKEYGVSIYPNPVTGDLGVGYQRNLGFMSNEIRFILVDHSNLANVTVSPSQIMVGPATFIGYPSVFCENDGERWIFAYNNEFNCYVTESLEPLATSWMTPRIINDVLDVEASTVSVTSNGDDVCVMWTDRRNLASEFWVDHGTN